MFAWISVYQPINADPPHMILQGIDPLAIHEFAGQVSEFVDSFRRRVRDLLAFEATSRDHFVIFAHRSNDTRENLFAWN